MANDLKAIKAESGERTAKGREAYRAELERLLYWIYYTHKKPLSSFKVKDREAFEAFLRDPQPTEFWCASEPPGNIARYSPKWRPFMMRAIPAADVAVADRKVWAPRDGVLWIDPASGRARDNPGISEVSVAKAVSVVRGLMGWLVDQGYLGYNTWDARSPMRRRGHRHGHRLYRDVDSRLRHTAFNAEGRLHLISMSTARRGQISLGQADKYLFADQTVPA